MNLDTRRRPWPQALNAVVMAASVSVFVIAAGAPSVEAQPAAPPTPSPPPTLPAPSASDLDEARDHFEAGNARFADNDFALAIEHYRAALALWDTPAIHFNLAVALIELDRSLEAYDHLGRAVAGGEAALGDRLPEARNYLRLVRARLSTLALGCEREATCELDGAALTAGGEVRLLEPGTHVVVARRPGFATQTRTVVLEPGERTELSIALERLRPRMVRRWRASRPWLTAGAGAAAAGVGGALLWLGHRDMAAANDAVDELCADGCPAGLPRTIASQADRARLEQRLGVGGLAIGSAAVVAGLVLVYLNQPRAELAPLGVALDDDRWLLTWRGAL